MRILITGFVVFVIWCFISAWIYNDKLLPVFKKPVAILTTPNSWNIEADSLSKLKAMMPKDLMIYFEFNNAKFKPDPLIETRVAEFKTWLDKYPGSMVSVTGNTDLVGSTDFNQALGLKRAMIVKKYLEGMGINTGRMVTDSKGEMQPAADYLTSEGRAKNRRTEISIKMK
jgi:outer membrane protein OmpA-like peptidoglycan-associated protein